MEAKKHNMTYRNLGNTGLKVSAISFGNMVNFEEKDFDRDYEILKFLIEQGVNFIDTAEYYGYGRAEVQLGNILKKLNVPREDLVISTKIFWGTGREGVNFARTNSRKHVIEGTLASLKRLQLDYVDIVFLHRFDPDTPIEETCRAMNWLIENNKCFYWGTSEWTAAQIVECHAVCDKLGLIHPVVEQPQYSMLFRDRFEVEYAPLFDNYKMGTTIWSPQAGGLLTGKWNNGPPAQTRFDEEFFVKLGVKAMYIDKFFGKDANGERNYGKLKALGELAKELGCTQAQLSIAWTLYNKDVSTALIGARTLEQAKDSVKAIEVVPKFTKEIEERINKILDNTPATPINFKTWAPFPPRR